MNKKILIWIFVLVLLVPIAYSEDPSYIFQQNRIAELNVPCIDSNNAYCQSGISCNITIIYPNGTKLVDNQVMTYSSIGHYKYSLNENQTTITGDYSTSVNCYGTEDGFSTFIYKITKSGRSLSDSPSIVGIIIALIGSAFITMKIAGNFQREDQRWYGMLFRAVLYIFAIGFCMMAIGTINELNIVIEDISSITGAVTLISNENFFIIVAIGIFSIAFIIERLLLRIKIKKQKEDEEWEK